MLSPVSLPKQRRRTRRTGIQEALCPCIALRFLGSSFLLLFYGAVCRSSFFARLSGGPALTIAAGYFILLSGVATAAALGPGMQQVFARGEFAVVRLRTWLNDRTISAHREKGRLTPDGR
jgi:hypothetical protein